MYSAVSSLLFAVFLLCTIITQNGAIPVPPSPTPHQTGDKVVIVVKNGKSPGSEPSQLFAPSGKEKRAERKGIFSSISLKRQGHLGGKQENSPPQKKEKSLLNKLLPTSRHVGSPGDVFRKNFHHSQKTVPILTEKRPLAPPGSHIPDFRPHQPDITPDLQNGKLPLAVGFNDDQLLKPRPTPMANKLNPYTNGVAASFPPGIDPYDGFMRYAAENLETPMGNIIDYHSLEHYYGPQHPLSLHNNKETNLNHPYADTFSYNGGNEIGNSPPPIHHHHQHQQHEHHHQLEDEHHPPPPPPHQGGSHHQDGFRNSNSPPGPRPGGAQRHNHPNTVNQQNYEHGHGIDHFHAPSPGMNSPPPRPRPPPSDPALYEEGHGHRTPPFEAPSPDHHPYVQNHHAPPFKDSTSEQFHHSPEPPDMDVFDEGPPESAHPPVPPPPDAPQDGPPHHQHHGGRPIPIAEQNDGGDDAIWGILDLAEMIEKGEIPVINSVATAGSPDKGNKPPPPHGQAPFHNAAPSGAGRVVVPVFTRPPPPRISSSGGGGGGAAHSSAPGPDDDHHVRPPPPHSSPQGPDDDHPGVPHPPPHSSPQKQHAYNTDSYDYDDHPDGGNFPGSNKSPPQYGGLDSQEAGNDYTDDLYKK